MVRVLLRAVRVDLQTNTPVLLLQETDGEGRTLPIFIGNPEATAIAYAIQGVEMPRPLTHDLMKDMLGALEIKVEQVLITELRSSTYFAELHLRRGEERTIVSSRPSDAVAVAVRRRAHRHTSVGISTAFLAAFVVFLFHASVDWMWESTAITVLALAGVAAIGARLARRGPRLSWWARAGLVVLCIGAGAVQLPGLLSTVEIRRSQAAERARNGNLALAFANDAVDVEPWSASAYEQRGLVLEAADRYGAAAVALRRAISDEPTNYVHWLDLARVETERGRIGAALVDYATAHRLRPDSTAFAASPSVKLR